MPEWAINGPDDTGLGRWIPTTSVDEYSATFASWFGVSATNLSVVLPNIGRFAYAYDTEGNALGVLQPLPRQ